MHTNNRTNIVLIFSIFFFLVLVLFLFSGKNLEVFAQCSGGGPSDYPILQNWCDYGSCNDSIVGHGTSYCSGSSSSSCQRIINSTTTECGDYFGGKCHSAGPPGTTTYGGVSGGYCSYNGDGGGPTCTDLGGTCTNNCGSNCNGSCISGYCPGASVCCVPGGGGGGTTYTVSVDCSTNKGSGTITSGSGNIKCNCNIRGTQTGTCKQIANSGDGATLIQQTNVGSFTEWSASCANCNKNGCSDFKKDCTLREIKSDVTVKASFVGKDNINIQCAGNGSGTIYNQSVKDQNGNDTVVGTCNNGNGNYTVAWTDQAAITLYEKASSGSKEDPWKTVSCGSSNCSRCPNGSINPDGTVNGYPYNCRFEDNQLKSNVNVQANFSPGTATATFTGNLQEYGGQQFCSPNIAANAPSITLSAIGASAPVTCPVDTNNTYNCKISSTAGSSLSKFNITATATNYANGLWSLSPGSNNQCDKNYFTSTDSQDTIAAGGTGDYNYNLYFQLQSDWVKLKDSSFAGKSTLSNIIPQNVVAYDKVDDLDGNTCVSGVGGRCFIINNTSPSNNPGAATAQSVNVGTADVSVNKWQADKNPFSATLTVSSFLDYVKGRKTYQSINNLSQITTGDTIYIITGDQTISNNGVFNNNNVVLIVKGNITIDDPKFNPQEKSLAILATGDIILTSKVNELDGIFIADSTINTGSSSQGLKIKGNLIAGALNNQRALANKFQPSVFIVFDPHYYFDLITQLSSLSYEWKQLQ